MWVLALACGGAFGVAYGLTGVGSVFAVPMLVLCAGAPGAPGGVRLDDCRLGDRLARNSLQSPRAGDRVPGRCAHGCGRRGRRAARDVGRAVVFAAFTVIVALRMLLEKWESGLGPTSAAGTAHPPYLPLSFAGVFVGIVAGLIGIGGVLIAPTLVLLVGIPINRAIATTMPVVFMISLSAISSHLLASQRVPPGLTLAFAGAGAAGLLVGMRLRHRLAAPRLQAVFAMAMLAVAAFILLRAAW